MKHLKLFENRSIQSMKNIINEYNDLYDYLLPIIKNKYHELAADPDYDPEPHSDQPYIIHEDQLVLQHIKITPKGFEFCLQTFNSDGEIQGTYYITISEFELKNQEMYKKSKKYNL